MKLKNHKTDTELHELSHKLWLEEFLKECSYVKPDNKCYLCNGSGVDRSWSGHNFNDRTCMKCGGTGIQLKQE